MNQYLPAMDEYVSPLYYENTIINNENTFLNNYSEPFYAGVQPEMPDNPELETPFNWLDFIDFPEFWKSSDWLAATIYLQYHL